MGCREVHVVSNRVDALFIFRVVSSRNRFGYSRFDLHRVRLFLRFCLYGLRDRAEAFQGKGEYVLYETECRGRYRDRGCFCIIVGDSFFTGDRLQYSFYVFRGCGDRCG